MLLLLFVSWSTLSALQLTVRLGDVAVFENRQPVAAAKFITKSSLFILLLGVIRRLELKLITEQKVEYIFVARHIAKLLVVRRSFELLYRENHRFIF